MPPSSSALPVPGCLCLPPDPACLPSQYCSSETLWLPCMPADLSSIRLAGALAAAAAAFCSCMQVSMRMAYAALVIYSDKGLP